jgi:hypothetical protein
MSRQGGLRTRPYPDPAIRYSLFFSIPHSPFAIRTVRWVSTNEGWLIPVTARARHAVPLHDLG